MKKIFVLMALILGCAIFGINVSADEEYITKTISGYSESGVAGEKVTIMVFSGTSVPENINPLAAYYYNQTTTEVKGFYSFDISFLENEDYVLYTTFAGVSEAKIQYITNSYILNENFETHVAGNPTGEMSTAGASACFSKTISGAGSYIGIDPKGGVARLYKKFPEISEGRLKVEFKFMTDSLEVCPTYLRFMTTDWTQFNSANSEYMLETLSINKGNLACYLNSKGFADITAIGTYNINKWVEVEIWLDMDNRMIYYFIDNQYAGKEVFNTDQGVTGFSFSLDSTSGSKIYFDDFVVKRLEYDEILSMYENCNVVPDEFLNEISFNITSNNVGNIFFGNEEISLNVESINNTSDAKELDLEINILDYDGNLVSSEDKILRLGGEEKETFEFLPGDIKFGVYTLEVTDKNTGITRKASFSRSVESEKKNDRYGTNVHMLYNRGNTDKLMPLIEKSGYGMTRDVWKWQETANGEHNPNYGTMYERYFNQSIEADNDMFAVLGLENSKYKDSDGGLATDESSLLALENYAEKFAAYYKDSIKYIELGNEYNHSSKGATPEEYYKCMKAAYTGIKKGNKDAVVIGFATAGIEVNYIEKVLKLCQADGFYPFDAISVHTYNINMPEAGRPGKNFTFMDEVAGLAELTLKYGISDKQLYMSETGWYTKPLDWDNAVDRETQGAYLLRTFALNDAYKLFDKLVLYDFQDDGVSSSEREYNWGTIESFGGVDTPYAAKPAFLMIANYNKLLADAECDGIEKVAHNEDSSESYMARYERKSDGATIYMLWNTIGDKIYTLPLAGKSAVRVYDALGNNEFVSVTDGTVDISVGIVPVYVEVLDAFVNLTVNGNVVDSISTVKAGDVISAEVFTDISDAKVLVAGYSGGRFSDVSIQSAEYNNIEYIVKPGVDSVKIMIWDKNQTPLKF